VTPRRARFRATREQVLAFRLASNRLARRLPPGSLLAAAAACGIQETPHGTAPLALAARVEGLTPHEVERALAGNRTLLAVWAMRGAPHLVPAGDAEVFTAGALPADEVSFAAFLGGWAAPVVAAGVPAATLAERLAAADRHLALDGSPRAAAGDGGAVRVAAGHGTRRRPGGGRAPGPVPGRDHGGGHRPRAATAVRSATFPFDAKGKPRPTRTTPSYPREQYQVDPATGQRSPVPAPRPQL